MLSVVRSAFCLILILQTNAPAANVPAQPPGNPQQDAKLQPAPQGPTLEDGTPVRLRISQTISSADAHVNDRVEFEVLEDVRVADTLIIPKGGIAWGTVTEAEPNRRMARGGKLEIVMDSVRLVDGERAALRATKEVKGGGHTGAMTAGIVATGLIFWPAAPFFLFMHGKDITIPKGTELPTFVNGNFQLDLAKFRQLSPSTTDQSQLVSGSGLPTGHASSDPQLEITSTPSGADIDIDGSFVGSTPSTVGVLPGEHTITIKKRGSKPWVRKLKVTTGKIAIAGELETDSSATQNAQ
jgi:hypothetical protein